MGEGLAKLVQDDFEVVSKVESGRELLRFVAQRTPDLALINVPCPRLRLARSRPKAGISSRTVRLCNAQLSSSNIFAAACLVAWCSEFVNADAANPSTGNRR